MYSLEKVKREFLLLDVISGSRAYGLATETSDTDYKGVFLMPQNDYYGLKEINQVTSEKNDEVYYELGRFFELLLKNNPNVLEVLFSPKECILFKHPAIDLIKPELFLSKICNETFVNYAQSQIRKARGLNKKVLNPMDEKRKSVLDFCYVSTSEGSLSLKQWLSLNSFKQEECGLVKLNHMKDMYLLYHQNQVQGAKLKGIMHDENSNEISLSSVETGVPALANLYFGKDSYSNYCKDYKAYWDWVKLRNEIRYENVLEHGKNYDAKNMMHTFRLLEMANEIALNKRIEVKSQNRQFLLKVKSGFYTYEELLELAESKIKVLKQNFEVSDLPDEPNFDEAENVLVQIRKSLYKQKGMS